jgi:enediyne biosynthesis protein E4
VVRRLAVPALLLALFPAPFGLAGFSLLALRTAAPPASPAPAPASALRFREVSAPWGLGFRHHHAGTGSFYMIETMGSGVVVWDYDGDGDEDVLFMDSGPLPGYRGEPPRTVLYRNDGVGRFADMTARSGIAPSAYGMGATAGDVDGDGDLDLYTTAFGATQLFLNRGDGTFEDATARSGAGYTSWSTSAAFADVDRDGDLDLYATDYVDFSFEDNPPCGLKERGLRSYCHPDVYDGLPDRFFRNRGDGTFEDATARAGFASATGKGMGVLFADLDEDGWPDLYVANDMTPNFLFLNRGDGTFEEIGMAAGVALSDLGAPEAGMGVDAGDLDGNGFADVMVTNLDLQSNAVYSNQGGNVFLDGRYVSRLAEPSIYKVGFGIAFADFDHDADLDVVVANGHIIHNIERFGTGTTYKQRNQLFENLGKGQYREVLDSGLDVVRSSRGLAAGDLDGDGDLDLAINNSDDLAEVYENVGAPGNWLAVDLAVARGNRHGIGARLELEGAGRRQEREVRTAASYLSQSALTAHFGLGAAPRADRLTVRWPDGKVQVFEGLAANRRMAVVRQLVP